MATTPFFPGSSMSQAGRLVDQADVVAVHGDPRAAVFARHRHHAVGDGEDRPAAFGLPVVVDDRLADRVGDPRCGRLVERLAGEKEQAQARQVVRAQVLRVLLLEHADRGRRGEHRGDAVLLDQLPPDPGVGPDRQAFVEDRRHAGDQRAVDDVAVADDPADVAGREVGLARAAAEDVLHARRERDRVAAGVALHALRTAGRPARVERVARVVGVDPGAGNDVVEVPLAQGGIVLVPAGDAVHRRQAAIDEQHLRGLVPREADGVVEQGLVGDDLAGAAAGIGADDHGRLGVIDPIGEADAREAAEHDRMDRADARARQHREHRLGNHRHVDQDAVAEADAERDQHRRHALDFAMQLAEGVDALLAGLGRDVDQRLLGGARDEVAVDGVVAEVRRGADEPANERRLAVVEDLLERPAPIDELRLLGPERLGFVERATPERLEFGRRFHHAFPFERDGGISTIVVALAGVQPVSQHLPGCRLDAIARPGAASTPRSSSRSTSSTLLPTG